MSVLFFHACKKKGEETIYKDYLTGTLIHDVPSYMYKSTTYTFTASGITKPDEGLTYRWSAIGFTPDSCLSHTFTCITPNITGVYPISVIVACEGYYDQVSYPNPIIISPLFLECVTGIIPGSNSTTDPRDGAVYYTRTYGNLEWFVQNLNWAGAGFPYGKVEALGTPFGRLYSWNEATTGVKGGGTHGIAATGLGEGPQGVCPAGWSVPTNEDWAHLATVVGGSPLSFFDYWQNIADPLCAYAKLNDEYLWPYSPRNLKGNSAAWNGLPGGNGTNYGTNFGNKGNYGFWLSSSEADAQNGYFRFIYYDTNQFSYHFTDKDSFSASVRCVRLVNNE
jgi:uncharacterized protein (TIGR02145 family)